MNLEELSTSQVVMLTLLVSFVTSIATGIITVSLMQQAPPAIAQTVNRVIEQTVQQVVPQGQSAASALTQEKTVVVSDSDLIAKAVARVSPSIVRIYSGSGDSAQFLGLGVVLDSNGTVAADAGSIGDNADGSMTLASGETVRAFVKLRDADTGIAYFTPATSTSDKAPTWVPAVLSANHATLGQSVVVVFGRSISRIASGLIAALPPSAGPNSVQIIETDISSDAIMGGSPLISTDGSIVGISTGVSRATDPSAFVPASVVGSIHSGVKDSAPAGM